MAEFRRFVPPVLRSILVDYVRSCKPRHARRTGANLDLDRLIGNIERRTGDLLDLHAALQGLSGLGEAGVRAASIVDLRFFAGLSTSETAAFLGVSERTIERDWTFARSWLRARLRGRPAQRMRADGGT